MTEVDPTAVNAELESLLSKHDALCAKPFKNAKDGREIIAELNSLSSRISELYAINLLIKAGYKVSK